MRRSYPQETYRTQRTTTRTNAGVDHTGNPGSRFFPSMMKAMKKGGTATRKDGSLVEHYESDIYYVDAVRHLGDILQVMIRRHDWQPVSDWRDKQAIKNQIAGPESEAIELYPAESRVVDYANWAHLWLLPGGEAFPFGFSKGKRFRSGSGSATSILYR